MKKSDSTIIGTIFSFLFFLIGISITFYYLNYNINKFSNALLKDLERYEESSFEIIEILDNEIYLDLPEIKIKNIGKSSLDLGCFKIYINGNFVNFSYEIDEIFKDNSLNPPETARIKINNLKPGLNKIELISCNGKKFEKVLLVSNRTKPWLYMWNFRMPIYILERSVQDLTYYQVLVIVNTQTLISQGKMRSDCGDIRFTDSNGVTLLPYWIESGCNTTSTRIWIGVNLSAFSNKTIYMYYGNSNATSLSNHSSVFIWAEREIFPNISNSTWGSGTSNTEDTFNTYYHDARNEILIRTSDFGGDIVPVNITVLRIYVVQQPGRDLDNYRVRYQLTNRTSLTSSFTTTGWILVFGPVNLGRPTAGTIVNLTLNPQIIWTNHSLNLLLDLSRDTTSYASGGGMYRKLVNISNTTCTFYGDSSRAWPFDGTCTLRDYVPSIIFTGWYRKVVNPEPYVILSNTEEKI